MIEFLKNMKQRSLLSNVLYYVFNIGLVVVLFILSQTIKFSLLAVVIVLLSKWRILAVRPRYWLTNIQANMVDIIVGVGVVLLMYLPDISRLAQIILALLYLFWLLVIKPLSSKNFMTLQAFICIITGVTALYTIAHQLHVAIVVALMAIIGFSAARHFLQNFDEKEIIFISSIWGLIFAEIGWLAYYWVYSYSLTSSAPIKLPQITIIAALLSLLAASVYNTWACDEKITLQKIAAPTVFAVILLFVIVVFFNKVVV